jgi:predicted phosphodiesterase
MKVKVLSDLHHDKTDYQRTFFPKDKEHGLILAGDIFHSFSVMNQMKLQQMCQNFKWVIYVLGNHDYEGSSINGRLVQWRNFSKKFTNLYILENESIVLDDVRYIGATLWTNYFNKNPIYMNIAQMSMPEFELVKNNNGDKLIADDIYDLHASTISYFSIELSQVSVEKTVIISHHMPLRQSVDSKFANHPLNCAFYSDLSSLFQKYDFNYWIHGHTHTSADYMFQAKRVICNPRGYGIKAQNRSFQENFIIEL